MPTTSNFGWTTPADTDLVKDGAAAIRTLGNAIDTSFLDLKGGTTGQILSKASNTDLDYTWITNDVGDITAVTAGTGISGGGTSGAVTITNSMATEITASGDIIVGTGSSTFDNLPIGSTGQVLTADTTVSPYKVKWATPSGAKNFSLLNTGGTALTGATTVTVSGITGMDDLYVIVENASAGTSSAIYVRFNSVSTGSKYGQWGMNLYVASTYSANNFYAQTGTANEIKFATGSNNGNYDVSGVVAVRGCNTAGIKMYEQSSGVRPASGNTQELNVTGGYFNDTNTISSVSIISTVGNLDNGTVYVYGAA